MTYINTILEANTLIDNVSSIKNLKNVIFDLKNRNLLNDFCNQEFKNLINLYHIGEISMNDIYNILDELKFKINN
jgi:hypothetical protein